jgi:hypothetical protein
MPECINYSGYHKSLSSPASRTLSETSSFCSALTIASDATVVSDAIAVSPYVLSDWERTTYYISRAFKYFQSWEVKMSQTALSDVLKTPWTVLVGSELLYPSDLLENPFPIPEGRHSHLPTKTVYEVFNTSLNANGTLSLPRSASS